MSVPHHSGRGRRAIGLLVLIGGLVLSLAMLVSTRWWFGYAGSTRLVDLGDGTLYVATERRANAWSQPLFGWCGGENRTYLRSGGFKAWAWTWWAWGDREHQWSESRRYSVWPLAPMLILVGGVLFWPGAAAAWRVRRNLCAGCGYPRAGLAPDKPCPECGRTPPGVSGTAGRD